VLEKSALFRFVVRNNFVCGIRRWNPVAGSRRQIWQDAHIGVAHSIVGLILDVLRFDALFFRTLVSIRADAVSALGKLPPLMHNS
jgi:hypothetical protein